MFKVGDWVIVKPLPRPSYNEVTSFVVVKYDDSLKDKEVEPFIGELPSFIKENR